MEYEMIHHLEGTGIKIFVVSINHREFHCHSDIEVIMVLQGCVDINMGKESHLLAESDIFIINRYDIHALSRTDQENRLLVFQINPTIVRPYFNRIDQIRFNINYLTHTNNPAYYNDLRHSFISIVDCYLKKKENYQLELVSILNHILFLMTQHDDYFMMSDRDYSSRKRNIKRIFSILDYIQHHYSENITLKEIARMEDLDMYYMSALIKKQLGISFLQYLNHLRTEKAALLLTETNLSNMDICIESGFSDYRYLNKAIQEAYGCTPDEYRTNHSNKKFRMPDQNEQHKIFDEFNTVQLLEKLIKDNT